MAWEAEKHVIALEKLHKWWVHIQVQSPLPPYLHPPLPLSVSRFKAVVECERVVVWSLLGSRSVSSYRVPRPSQHFLTQLEKEFSSHQLQTPGTVAYSERREVGASEGGQEGGAEGEVRGEEEEGGREGEGDGKMSKQEARRLRREKRKKEVSERERERERKKREGVCVCGLIVGCFIPAQWEELMARRPEKGEEDPEEAAMVEQFRGNMGDFKLKTASDYVVPKHQRITFSEKKRSLILLRNQVNNTHTHTHSLSLSLSLTHTHTQPADVLILLQIFECKREYNHKLLALRDWKKEVMEKVDQSVCTI